MIVRDPQAAARQSADLIVIGGGIYGIALTLEAARRGLKPVLIERQDFGGRTSWNSLRIVHGGLRYLQRLDLPRYRESVEERRWWLTHFPELVVPLPCLMPLYGRGLRRRSVLRAALLSDAVLSWDRNRGVPSGRRLRRGKILSGERALARCGWLDPSGLEGGALWFDAFMVEPQRLLIEMLHWACAAGATTLNYVEAMEPLLDGDRICGVRAHDHAARATIELRAPVVVNCAGPWCREVARRLDRDLPELFQPSLAVNLLLDREPLTDAAVAVMTPRSSRQTYFLVPWEGRLLAGTYHAASDDRPGGAAPGEHQIGAFLDELDTAAPRLEIRRQQVARVFWGQLPARHAGSARLATREAIVHSGDCGGPHGLFNVSGIKFTTARAIAQKTLRRILGWQRLALPPASCERPDSGRDRMTLGRFQQLLDRDRPAAGRYLQEIARRESIVHLEDAVLRRHDWGLDPAALAGVAEAVGGLLGWRGEDLDRQLRRLAESSSSP